MSSDDKDTQASASNHPVRDALGTAAGLHAEKKAIEHDIENARQVASAEAKAVAADAKLGMAEAKRELQERIDDARVNAHKRS
jgi:hypothetical protein